MALPGSGGRSQADLANPRSATCQFALDSLGVGVRRLHRWGIAEGGLGGECPRGEAHAITGSERKCIHALVRRDVNMLIDGDECLEASYLAHRFRGSAAVKNHFTGIGAKTT
jgi:hypothetical protein